MPAPLAKGIIITVSVLIAAGIAVYESPQFRRWISNSRRKIAVALHSIGDEIHPRDQSRPLREDISMTEEVGEEVGEAAEERRRKAREEIKRRAALLEARRRKKTGPAGTFDELVDKDGNLRKSGVFEDDEDPLAKSTAVDTTGGAQAVRRHDGPPAYHPEVTETGEKDRLHIAIPSETSSNHPSESLVDLTPTSETSRVGLVSPGHHEEQEQEPLAQSEYFSISSRRSSSHTLSVASDLSYAHLGHLTSRENQDIRNPFANPQGHDTDHEVSSTPSIARSASHIQNETADASSDGTLSEIGYPAEGVITPTSWSEIGSVVSGDDGFRR